MKKYLIYPLAIIISIGSMALSCDDTSELFDITTDQEFSETLKLDSEGETTVENMTVTETINPSDASNFNSLKDRIKDLTVNRITYKIVEAGEGHSADATLSVDLAFGASGSSQVTTLATISSALAEVGTETDINVAAADLETIKTLLMNGDSIDIEAIGNLENGPVNVEVIFTIYVSITAAP